MINQAISCGRTPVSRGQKIEVMTLPTDSIRVNLFAHYAASSEDGSLEYHQYLGDPANLADSHQGSMMARREPRDGKDRARKPYAMRDHFKEHRRQHRGAALRITTG